MTQDTHYGSQIRFTSQGVKTGVAVAHPLSV